MRHTAAANEDRAANYPATQPADQMQQQLQGFAIPYVLCWPIRRAASCLYISIPVFCRRTTACISSSSGCHVCNACDESPAAPLPHCLPCHKSIHLPPAAAAAAVTPCSPPPPAPAVRLSLMRRATCCCWPLCPAAWVCCSAWGSTTCPLWRPVRWRHQRHAAAHAAGEGGGGGPEGAEGAEGQGSVRVGKGEGRCLGFLVRLCTSL